MQDTLARNSDIDTIFARKRCPIQSTTGRGGSSSSYPIRATSDTDLKESSLSTMTGVILSIVDNIGKASRPFGSSQTPKDLLRATKRKEVRPVVEIPFFIFGRQHYRFGLGFES